MKFLPAGHPPPANGEGGGGRGGRKARYVRKMYLKQNEKVLLLPQLIFLRKYKQKLNRLKKFPRFYSIFPLKEKIPSDAGMGNSRASQLPISCADG